MSSGRVLTVAIGPLAGLRIIDFTQMLAGPYCTMLLADLGADVIKVEPLTGDDIRLQGPFAEGDGADVYGGYFQSINRNKRSIALDLKTDDGQQVALRLIDGADVVVENFRVGVMERIGLGYEKLAERNARLVYVAVRGFGDPRTGESPYVEWPAYDVVSQAMGGMLSITGLKDGEPVKVGPGVGDIFPATLAAVGLLAAVRHADKTGQGQFVDVAMYDAIMAMCERMVYQYSFTGIDPVPEGSGHPLFSPFGIFATADGWVAIAAPRDHQWRALSMAMGRLELASDERFADSRARAVHMGEVQELLTAWTSTRSTKSVVEALGGKVPCGPVNRASDLFADPHVHARGMLVEVEQPGAGPVIIAGMPIKMTETPRTSFRRAPLLAEDGRAVLEQLGYSPQEIAVLQKAGVVGVPDDMSDRGGT